MTQPQYDTFELLISKSQEQSYPVTITRSPVGEANATLHIDDLQSERLSNWLTQLENGSCSAPRLTEIGKLLYQSLFTEQVNTLYHSALSQACATEKSLRICLRIEPPEIAALPWELLYDESESRFLSISPETPLSRYIPLQTQARQAQVSLPLSILVVISRPTGLPTLDFEHERSLILDAWREQIDQGLVQVHFVERAIAAEISQALRTHRPQIFHFIGHGTFEDGQAMIALENEHGQSRLMDDRTFREFFSGITETRLVVLNACESGQTSSIQALAGLAPLLLQRQITAVVAMQYKIPDQASRIFARDFYRSLALGYPVDAAISEARKELYIEMGADSRDWLTPVLFMRAQDGYIIKIQRAKKTSTGRSPRSKGDKSTLHVGNISNVTGSQINIASGDIIQAAPTPAQPPPPSSRVAANPPRLTSDLYMRIRRALLDCGPFESDQKLRAVFADPRLQPWQNGLPQASSTAERVDLLLDYLRNARNSSGDSVLVIFLIVLYERMDPADAYYHQLARLADELSGAL